MSASVIFSAGISLLKRVCKMSKSATGHADAIRFWGHIHAMHWRNSSLHLGNKMVQSSNIDSNHETLVHFGHHCSASYICAHIIQRILWYYNGYCDCHWNRIQRFLWFITNTCHWIIQNPGGRIITYNEFLRSWWAYSWVCLYSFMLCVLALLLRCLSNFRAIRHISRAFNTSRDLTIRHLSDFETGSWVSLPICCDSQESQNP